MTPTGPSTRSAADRGVYPILALVIALVVALGFGRRLNQTLLAPVSPRPWILYAHAVMFMGWVILFVAQTALVRVRRIAWHRRGAAVPVSG